jgi:RNA-directed DNA polymerase
VEKAKRLIEIWLQDIGLEIQPSKTRITHTLHHLQDKAGFNFLGMTIRQYPVGQTHSGKGRMGRLLGFKTLIKPSKEAVKRHMAELRAVVRAHQAAPQEALIGALNPIVSGWCNYYRTVVAKVAFSHCDDRLYRKLRHWALHRHPTKVAGWVIGKYWAVDQGEGWQFKAHNGSTLKKHAATPIKRHVKVKGTASPYDGNLAYWAQRLKEHPLVNNKVGYLLKLQHGRCACCGLYLKDGDVIEVDHIIPRRLGGDDRLTNFQLLHRHCHDQKTAQDGSNQARTNQGISDKDHLIEEPDEANVSRPVLERGRGK